MDQLLLIGRSWSWLGTRIGSFFVEQNRVFRLGYLKGYLGPRTSSKSRPPGG